MKLLKYIIFMKPNATYNDVYVSAIQPCQNAFIALMCYMEK